MSSGVSGHNTTSDTNSGANEQSAGPAQVAAELLRVVDDYAPRLRAIDDEASHHHDGDHWSPRQTLGHLIDSAANNHVRFVRGQIEEDLVFPGYAQEEWVELEGYDDAPWSELVELWQAYNRHLARVIARIDTLEWSRPRARHNFDRIGFAPIEASRLGSLAWLVVDYLTHLRHHLDHIMAASAR